MTLATDRRCAGFSKTTGEPCKSPYLTEGQEYCYSHDPELDSERRANSARGGRSRSMRRSTCALDGCSKRLPVGRAKWCSDAHSKVGKQRERTERRRLEAGEISVASQLRRPPPRFYEMGYHLLERPSPEQRRAIAEEFDVDQSTVTRWFNYVLQERVTAREAEDWEEPKRNFPAKWRDLKLEDLEALVKDFMWFRGEFFQTEDEEPYVFAPFHLRWLRALLTCFITKSRLMILSPPRHGKTELLSHLVVWLICRFPNIRIIWVGPIDDIAQDLVGMPILEHLESNQKLIDAFCPPGIPGFKPKGRGRSWNKESFTVATRTVFGIKSPTAKFMGRGGTLVSRDADVIICDDIEQDKTVSQPNTRLATRNWASTSLFSRKTKKTAICFIGSRQHPDDLWEHFLGHELFETIVETAHDRLCELPTDNPAKYDEHTKCMLWPEVNPFEWLMDALRDNEETGGRAMWEMIYLNRVTGKGVVMFQAAVVAACRDEGHVIGDIPSPYRPPRYTEELGGVGLVAGLDPSGVNYQAAFLWAYQIKPELRMWLVDLENEEGGGIAKARATIEGWTLRYGVKHWVVEENLYQGGIIADEGVIELQKRLHIVIEPHWTDQYNKWDQYLGVSTLAPLFESKKIVLPYGNEESILKSDLYQRQLVNFADAPRNKNKSGVHTDVVMASWFPMSVIRRAKIEFGGQAKVNYSPSYSSYGTSGWNTPPWGYQRSA